MSIRNLYPLTKPSLNLDFSNTKALDPRITFARASNATFFDNLGILRTAAAGVARFDHNPVTGESLGLLVEEQRTNSIRNNTMVGAVAGTPGTGPTNWALANPADGITQQIVGIGTDNGISYIEVRYSGTATSNSFKIIRFEALNNIAASSGQTWTAATYMRIVAGSAANISMEHQVAGYSSGGALSESTNVAPSLTTAWNRFAVTRALNNVNTAFVASYFAFSFVNGAAIDITLRIGMPQLEQGAFATSVIPTTNAAATRAADAASMTGANFSSWYRQDEGTLFTEFTPRASAGIQHLFAISDGSNNNRIQQFRSGTSIQSRIVAAGVQTNPGNTTAALENVTSKAAMAYKVGTDQGASVLNGGVAATSSPAATPTVTTLALGQNHVIGNLEILNGTIRKVAYYPKRLANDQLQGITTV